MIDRHMDIKVLQDLFFDANLKAEVAENFGTDLFLWRSNLFYKHQGDRDGLGTGENKWHHDRHFENGDAPLNIYDASNHFTILLALTDVGMDAGRVEYVKGSHQPIEGFNRDIPRHIQEVPEVVQDRVTPLPLERGQFVLFHSSLLIEAWLLAAVKEESRWRPGSQNLVRSFQKMAQKIRPAGSSRALNLTSTTGKLGYYLLTRFSLSTVFD